MSGNRLVVGVLPLLTSITAATVGEAKEPYHTNRSFEAYGNTISGSGAATVLIQVKNAREAPWETMGTITLTLGSSVTGDGFATTAPWRYVRANVTSISGTGAQVSVDMGTAPL